MHVALSLLSTEDEWRAAPAGAQVRVDSSTVGAPHPGKLRMNIEIKPSYAVDYMTPSPLVAPHGLLGQVCTRGDRSGYLLCLHIPDP